MTDDVRTGIDVLQADGFRALKGMRVGLVTNHTGLNRAGVATVDLLHSAPNVRLRALFSPEHGIRGALDSNVADSTDDRTGLPVFSLYGVRNRPTAEQLNGLDALLFDIQDIGTRFYTYISTLGHCLEACSERHVSMIVLDRPNPLGGTEIEGPIADADSLSFTAYHPLPIRHGLTVGELARLFVHEKRMTVNLKAIAVEGWRRRDQWDATGLTWVNPSPNMRSFTEAMLYPGIGLVESTNVSVGRGTDTPFEVVGAPWIDGRALANALNSADLPGVRFVPIRFTPKSSDYAGTRCGGVNVIITAWYRFSPVLTGLTLAATLRQLFPTAWEASKFNNLLDHKRTFEALLHGADPRALAQTWSPDIERFRRRRKPILLYS